MLATSLSEFRESFRCIRVARNGNGNGPTEDLRFSGNDIIKNVESHADFNTIDKGLTEVFTQALKEKGFSFPALSVNGKFTILKPFDEGVFLVDADYQVFHVKRRDGQPVVVRIPIDPALKTRHIKIAENRRREYYGFLHLQSNPKAPL